MKKYNTPEIEIVDLADVLTTSNHLDIGESAKDELPILPSDNRNDWWR